MVMHHVGAQGEVLLVRDHDKCMELMDDGNATWIGDVGGWKKRRSNCRWFNEGFGG
jgi:hypothetical protein